MDMETKLKREKEANRIIGSQEAERAEIENVTDTLKSLWVIGVRQPNQGKGTREENQNIVSIPIDQGVVRAIGVFQVAGVKECIVLLVGIQGKKRSTEGTDCTDEVLTEVQVL